MLCMIWLTKHLPLQVSLLHHSYTKNNSILSDDKAM